MRAIKRAMKNKGTLAVAGTSAISAGLVVAETANAAITWTGVELNTADIEGYMAIAVVGLAVLWGLRKVVKMMNRS